MDVPGENHPLQPGYCANCGTPLSGRFCSACGQRVDTAAHTLGHFIGEAAEVLTHADSRLWRTAWPLLARPGFLTREYFAGRRARYLQPFRLYLIMSVLYFVLSALLGTGESTGAGQADVPRAPLSSLDCTNIRTDVQIGTTWWVPRLEAACRNLKSASTREFNERLVHNLGRALFVFLPVMAALMKLLYWKPRRYYLEHLLLLIHNHSFAFLMLAICSLLTHWISSRSVLGVLFLLAAWYMVRYLYRSMKNFYEQSRWLTAAKFVVLGCAYLLCGLIMLLATMFYSAATI